MSGAGLRKIYDALDARNYKAALKLCEKASKSSRVALALKALTLQRLGKRSESGAICDDLMAMPIGEMWSDTQLVSALTMALTSLGREMEACLCWERSLESKYDQSIALELFRLSLRHTAVNGPKLRTIATRLYKETHESIYLFWVAAIALTEARIAGNNKTNQMKTTLRLAERMAAKAVGTGGYSAQELELVLGIKGELGEKPLDTLRSARQSSVHAERPPSSAMLELLEAQAMAENGDTTEAYNALVSIVRAKPDDWPAVASLAQLGGSNNMSMEAQEIFCQIAQSSPESLGPRLGLLELWRHFGDVTRLQEALLQYLQDKAASRSCFDDLQMYLAWIARNGHDLNAIAGDFEADNSLRSLIDFEMTDTVMSQTTENVLSQETKLQALATRAKCARYLGLEMPLNCTQLASAAIIAHKYGNYDIVDDFAVLCFEQARDQDDTAILIEGCCFLEWARTCRKDGNSPMVELSAMRALERLGASEAGLRLYGSLGVKQIQLESLGYLLFPWCARSGFFKEAKLHCTNIQTIHRSARSDAGEFAFAALENSNYNTAVDLLVFQASRMDPSFQLALARVAEPVLALVTELHTLNSAKTYFSSNSVVLPNTVVVNCDLHVWPAWRDKQRGRLDGEDHKIVENRFAVCAKRYLNIVSLQRELALALVELSSDKLGLVLQSLEKALENAHISNEEDDAVRASCSNQYNENCIPWLAHPWCRQLWQAAIYGYRFAMQAMIKNLSDPVDAIASVAALRLALLDLGDLIFSERKPSIIVLSRIWIAGVCDLLLNVLAPLGLVFQACAPSINTKKKQHNKKSKAQVVRTPLETAFRAAAAQAAQLLYDLRAFLRARTSLLDDHLKDTTDWLPPAPLGLLPPDLAATQRAALRTTLIEGQILSIDRILDIIGAKHVVFSEFASTR